MLPAEIKPYSPLHWQRFLFKILIFILLPLNRYHLSEQMLHFKGKICDPQLLSQPGEIILIPL